MCSTDTTARTCSLPRCGGLTTTPASVTSRPNEAVNPGAAAGSACSITHSAPTVAAPARSGAVTGRLMYTHHTAASTDPVEATNHIHADSTDQRPSAIPAANAAAIQAIGGNTAPPLTTPIVSGEARACHDSSELLFRCDFLHDARGKCLEGDWAQVAGAAAADGHLAATGFLVAHDQHVGDVVHLRAADLVTDSLVARIELDPHRCGHQAIAHVSSIVEVAICDRQDAHLLGRQPDREIAAIVLDEKRHHAFHRADDGPVDHHRTVRLAVLPDELQLEPLGEQEVELHRG